MSPRNRFYRKQTVSGVASRPGSMYQAGLLTFGSSPFFRLPISLKETVAGRSLEKSAPRLQRRDRGGFSPPSLLVRFHRHLNVKKLTELKNFVKPA
jgi:hypothetical protein